MNWLWITFKYSATNSAYSKIFFIIGLVHTGSDETRQAAIYLFVLYRTFIGYFLESPKKMCSHGEATGSGRWLFDILTNNLLRQVELLFLPQLAVQKRKGWFRTTSRVCGDHLMKTVKSLRACSHWKRHATIYLFVLYNICDSLSPVL